MKWYLDRASLLRKRNWRYITLCVDGDCIIEQKNVEEIVKFAAYEIWESYKDWQANLGHQENCKRPHFDLIAGDLDNATIYIDGYVKDDALTTVVWVSVHDNKLDKEFLLGLYGGDEADKQEYDANKGLSFMYNDDGTRETLTGDYKLK